MSEKTLDEIQAQIKELQALLPFDLRGDTMEGCSVCDMASYPEARAGEHNATPEHRQWLKLGGKRNLTKEALEAIKKGLEKSG